MLDLLKHNNLAMNRLSKEQRTRIITALAEGNSLRATARMCDVSFNTVLKLVPHIGNMHYNFCRIHKSLRVTPAMEAGISDHVWEVEEIMALLPEPEFGPRGPYKKK